MTSRIQEQQGELIEANRQLDRRRHFTETVLTGVTSGVIGLDQNGLVTVANTSASELLGVAKDKMIGEAMVKHIPDIQDLLDKAHKNPNKITEAEIQFVRKDEERRVFLVRIAIELIGDEETGTILTFDDITELQSAQRKAAWADVARRIAHEIKNPLTPIQLSAERLNRRYLKQIDEDPDTFTKCIDTIIRHVGDIGHMVNEFSSFARMPEPSLKIENMNEQIADALVLHHQAHRDIDIKVEGLEGDILLCNVDAQQIRQAVNNLIQNAVDSLLGHSGKGKINGLLGVHGEEVFFAVSDDGPGFPKDEALTSLTEPYVTHKQKGTGLGLAIVKKIMDDHNGRIVLGEPEWLKKQKGWKALKGATAVLILPLESAEKQVTKKAS